MIFTETALAGAWIIDLEPIRDERGFFARTCCVKEFANHGLSASFVQCNLSYNYRRGTLRGLHYQMAPHEEVKLVSCLSGAIYDVLVDLRKECSTYGQWQAFELNASNHRSLYVPKGFAHGFLTLQDETSVCYQMSEFYDPKCARGIRWNDPAFHIKWLFYPSVLSEKDKKYGDYLL